MIRPGILKCGVGKLSRKTAAAQRGWNFGMPDRHPARSVRLEFEICSLAVLVDFEFVHRSLRAFVHIDEYILAGLSGSQGLNRGRAKRTGIAKLDPPNSRRIAKLIPITWP